MTKKELRSELIKFYTWNFGSLHAETITDRYIKTQNDLKKNERKLIQRIRHRCCATYDCKNRDNLTWLCHKNSKCCSQIK